MWADQRIFETKNPFSSWPYPGNFHPQYTNCKGWFPHSLRVGPASKLTTPAWHFEVQPRFPVGPADVGVLDDAPASNKGPGSPNNVPPISSKTHRYSYKKWTIAVSKAPLSTIFPTFPEALRQPELLFLQQLPPTIHQVSPFINSQERCGWSVMSWVVPPPSNSHKWRFIGIQMKVHRESLLKME